MTTQKVLGMYGRFAIVNDKTGKVMERVEGWAKDVVKLVRNEYGKNYTAKILENLDAN